MEVLETNQPETLIYDSKQPLDTQTQSMTATTADLARGAVIATDEDGNGVLWTDDDGETPVGILCDDLPTGATVCEVYRTGHFVRQTVNAKTGTLLTPAAEKALRDAGIYLSNKL